MSKPIHETIQETANLQVHHLGVLLGSLEESRQIVHFSALDHSKQTHLFNLLAQVESEVEYMRTNIQDHAKLNTNG